MTSYFRSKIGKWQLDSLTTGNIQQLLSLKNIRKFEVPLADKSIIDKITQLEKDAIDCEILAQKNIQEAKKLFYEGLKCDLKSIKKEDCFTVLFSQFESSNIWSPNLYNKLYVNTANALKESNGVKTLEELIDLTNGDEVGSDNYSKFIERRLTDIPFIRTSDIVNHEVDLYPDYYISSGVFEELNQDIKTKDIIFTKDGKVGCVGMITDEDKVILSSGIARLRIKEEAKKIGFTPEYIFIALSILEVGYYAAARRTVVASTIPHLREDRLQEIEIPFESPEYVQKITVLVEEAFKLKSKRKKMIKESDRIMDEYFTIN